MKAPRISRKALLRSGGLFLCALAILLLSFGGGRAWGEEAGPVRYLPASAGRGEVFTVKITFTAPSDDFNAIGISDEAPPGWEVQAKKEWCKPEPLGAKGAGNKAEIIWSGPFEKGTEFSAVYKVRIPQEAEPGVYSFGNGFLLYYIARRGPFREEIRGDEELKVVISSPKRSGKRTIGMIAGIAGGIIAALFILRARRRIYHGEDHHNLR